MMDASEKIISFNSLDELKQEIIKDTTSTDVLAQRYVVRFIMLNNFDTYCSLVKFLSNELNVNKLDIESLLDGDDRWITIDTLRDVVQNCTSSTILTPFSELARFYSEEDFRGFFNDIILHEDIQNKNKRIYIPLIGLQNRFIDFLKSFGRLSESAPIWQCNTTKQQIRVYLSKYSDFELPNTLELCQLSTMKEWLKFWKVQAPQEKVICSSRPIRKRYQNSKPDSIFTFQVIDNAYEFITSFLSLSVPIAYIPEEDYMWESLMDNLDKHKAQSFDFNTFVLQRYNRMNINSNDVLQLWSDAKYSAFDRWLFKHFLLSSNILENATYMKLCISEINDFSSEDSLCVKLIERVFYEPSRGKQEAYNRERLELVCNNVDLFKLHIPLSSQNWVKDRIIEIYQETGDLVFAYELCTSIYDFEKSLILGWYATHKDCFGIERVKVKFPELYAYLQPITTIGQIDKKWCIDYLQLYKESKLDDVLGEQLLEILSKYNKNAESFYKWYYSIDNIHDTLNKYCNGADSRPDIIYWIDGLGAEFLPLINTLVESSKYGYEVLVSDITRTNIPSNTHLNEFPVDGKTIVKLGELDKIAHESHYQRYNTLLKEVNTIKELITKIISDNSTGLHTIAIVSDHGLSALSRLVASKKIDKNTKHEGRYVCLGAKTDIPNEPEYVIHSNEVDGNYYKVALTHASLGNKPSHEVHGGCTPEEVLVPFIIITNDGKNKTIPYAIKLNKTSVAISSSVVEAVINPQPESAIIECDGREYQLTRKGAVWSAKLDIPEPGNYPIKIKPYKGRIQEIDVEFYGMGFKGGALNDFNL